MASTNEFQKLLEEVKKRLELLGDKGDFKEEFNKLESKADALLAENKQNAKELKEELKQEAKERKEEAKAESERLKQEAKERKEEAKAECERLKQEKKQEKEAEKEENLKREEKDKAANEELKAWMKEQNKTVTEKFQDFAKPTPRFKTDFNAEYLQTQSWDVNNTVNDLAAMTAEDWSRVIKMNKVLYGFVVESDVEGPKLVKARSPAFVVKPGHSEAFEALKPADGPASGGEVDGSSLVHESASGSSIATKSGGKVADVPEFEISDASSISITEATNSLQKSLAEGGFSESSITSAIGYGTFSVSAGICAGLKSREEASSTEVSQSDHKEYHASYNFPRVQLFLDELSMELSKDCRDALARINEKSTIQDLKDFSLRFGHVFATRIKLGGRLKSAKFADATFGSNDTERKEAMRVAMGAQFATPSVSANVNATNESQKVITKTNDTKFSSSSLTWTACGGDTLLCANPPLWAASVSSHKNWRVIEQDFVLPLHELIDRFATFADTTKLFKQVAGPNKPPVEHSKPNPLKKWTGKVSLSIHDYILVSGVLDGKSPEISAPPIYKPENSDELYLTNRRAERPAAATFQVFNGNTHEDFFGQTLVNLSYDNPILLVHGDEDLVIKGNQCDAVWMDDEFYKPMAQIKGRYWHHKLSLRRVAKKNDGNDKWEPNIGDKLRNGDLCHLYCHTSENGPYISLERPPTTASRLFVHKDNKSLKFAKDVGTESELANQGFQIANVVVEFI